MGKKICAVIPTKNEQASIEKVVGDLRQHVERLGHSLVGVIITDDSTDQTRKIAKAMGATVVIGEGKGLGYAMWKGLKASLKCNPDIIISMDADGQSEIKELERFLAPVISDEADLVLGSRFKTKGLISYSYHWKNRLGIRILVKILRYLTKLPLTDSHGGLRAMIPEVVKELEMVGTHTYVQETIIDAKEKGFRIKEIESAWRPRQEGSSRVVSSIPVYVFYTLPVLILRAGQHIKFLYPVGILFIFLSFLDFCYVLWDTQFSLIEMIHRQSFHLIFLLLSIGLNMFFIGFSLELINRIKCRLDKAYGSL
jgi:glycosyltransferase involved in cell wall biosynthesis